MSAFFNFKKLGDVVIDDSKFNEPIAGGGTLDEGEHLVKVTELVPYNQYNSILFKFENAEGKRTSKFVQVYETNRETREVTNDYSTHFLRTLKSILGTENNVISFLTDVGEDPHFLNALLGMTTVAKVVKGTKGYTIITHADGSLQVADAGAGTAVIALEEFGADRLFTTYKEVNAAIDTYNMSATKPLKRAFNSVHYLIRPSQEQVDENVKAIRSASEAKSDPIAGRSPGTAPSFGRVKI